VYPKEGHTRYGAPTKIGIVREDENILQVWYQGSWVDIPIVEETIDTTKQEETNISPVAQLPVKDFLDQNGPEVHSRRNVNSQIKHQTNHAS
jgi:hypothetical protein